MAIFLIYGTIIMLYNKGPNTKMIGNNGLMDTMFNYLSLRWFFYGAGDAYNPVGKGGFY